MSTQGDDASATFVGCAALGFVVVGFLSNTTAGEATLGSLGYGIAYTANIPLSGLAGYGMGRGVSRIMAVDPDEKEAKYTRRGFALAAAATAAAVPQIPMKIWGAFGEYIVSPVMFKFFETVEPVFKYNSALSVFGSALAGVVGTGLTFAITDDAHDMSDRMKTILRCAVGPAVAVGTLFLTADTNGPRYRPSSIEPAQIQTVKTQDTFRPALPGNIAYRIAGKPPAFN
jgi:hypothetical protein